MKNNFLFLLFLFIFNTKSVKSLCSRFPTSTNVEKSPVDENFAIVINNNPTNYIFGQEYNISLVAYNGRRYIGFSLALENEAGYSITSDDLGHFEITDPIETRYSPSCGNMIESTSSNSKNHSEVTWIAPTDPNSGCILIRATVLQHRDVWHMDDGALTKKICRENVDEFEYLRALQECCACDEARYELTFQGKWSRNVHPKDFPPKGWLTHFGDIIGAAHTTDYRFWNDSDYASPAMEEYAQYGSTQLLEREFNENFQNGNIRTIIKARGPAYPNLNSISVASVRVDRNHHLISLATKIDPSPDWFLGVTGMEVCMPNCTWLEERTINLYPWDAGIDSGPSYLSPRQPQKPKDVIRRIRSDFPNDPRSPFYDSQHQPMEALATLHVKRQRIYERRCEDEDSNNVNIPRECHTHPWSSWSECSTQCGEGHQFRTRVYKHEEFAKIYDCDKMIKRRESIICQGENCLGSQSDIQRKIINPYRKQNFNRIGDLNEGEQEQDEASSRRRGYQQRNRNDEEEQTEEVDFNEEEPQQRNRFSFNKPINQRGYQQRNRNQQNWQNNRNDEEEQTEFETENNNEEDIIEENTYEFSRQNLNSETENEPQNWNKRKGVNYNENTDLESHDSYENNGNGFEIGDLHLEPNNSRRGNYKFQQQRGRELNDSRANQRSRNRNYNSYIADEFNDSRANQRNPTRNYNSYIADEFNDSRANQRNPARNHNSHMADELNDNRANQRNSTRNYNFHMADDLNDNRPYQRNQARNHNSHMVDDNPNVPEYCFNKLRRSNNCSKRINTRNYWFYNYCQDECMLFATDCCDKIENQFNSLEECESTCKNIRNENYLRRQQQTTCNQNERRRFTRIKQHNKLWYNN